MRIGILALQGAFAEHKIMLEGLGAECFEIRQLKDLYAGPVNGLVFPGGESTVMDKLLRESGLFSPLRGMLEKGIPVLATCAGLILLAEKKGGRHAALLWHPSRNRPQECLRAAAGKLSGNRSF